MLFNRNGFVTPLAQLAVEDRTASDFVIREAFTGSGYPHLAFFKFLSLHCVTSFSFIPCVSGISIDSYTFRDMKRFLAWLLKPLRNGPLRVFLFHSCLLTCSSNLFHVSFCVTVRLHFCVLMFFLRRSGWAAKPRLHRASLGRFFLTNESDPHFSQRLLIQYKLLSPFFPPLPEWEISIKPVAIRASRHFINVDRGMPIFSASE